ncbi:M48 family metalloprotease [Oscillatoria sp. FACHB-1406]|uniref:M48 family metallopeptidase n=1 Tax=Oscillatoria sp. FACHB-1406 TaxID=2692846 RepID=UPI00168939B1|nr:M48 family metalloprotease [Oscillatoria sp. FACHB-1406]MBD2577474.1 M48 family metalloprotease [Oscillatoria sp. FACHB-1406]
MTSVPNPSLKAGETALRAGQYEDAIAHFQEVCATELDLALVNRARQALVVAYCRCDRAEDAILLCHELVQDPTPESAWATKTLADLIQRYPEANTLGLVPLQPKQKSKRPAAPRNLAPSFSNAVARAETPQDAAPTVFVPGRQWRNAERAKNWKRMKPTQLWRLWLIQLVCAIALFYLVRFSLEWTLRTFNAILDFLPLLRPIQLFYRNTTYFVLISFFILWIASPWLLDWLLTKLYGMERYSVPKLAGEYPEAAKVVQKMTQQKKLPRPQLAILPTRAPVAMTYGTLPRTARIAISQGLLEQLDDSELAVIYAAQIAQIIHWDFSFTSGAIALLQIPFTLYWQISRQGERLSLKIKNDKLKIKNYPLSIIDTLTLWISAILAAIFYTFYWLWRIPLLWMSRRRQYYSDRLAAEYMGNPNAITRALLKIAIGMADNVREQTQTSWLLESFDLLMPVGHRQALAIGSMPDKTPFREVLAWECSNPYRHWLSSINSHPLIGDRIYVLNRYANYWRLSPEIDLPIYVPPARTLKEKFLKLANCYRALPILQSAVLSALFFGLLLRGIFWGLGYLNERVLSQWMSGSGLIWMYNADNDAIARACLLFAFSLSIFIWINGYFPDVRIAPTRNEPRLQDLLSNPEALPPKSQGVLLTGTLIGREGISNWPIQDLMLQTSSGTIKLHFFTKLGPFGNVFWGLQKPLLKLPLAGLERYIPLYPRPISLIGRQVSVTGWFRRGSTPWIDVDTVRVNDKIVVRSGYPVWVMGLAIVAALRAAWLIWNA